MWLRYVSTVWDAWVQFVAIMVLKPQFEAVYGPSGHFIADPQAGQSGLSTDKRQHNRSLHPGPTAPPAVPLLPHTISPVSVTANAGVPSSTHTTAFPVVPLQHSADTWAATAAGQQQPQQATSNPQGPDSSQGPTSPRFHCSTGSLRGASAAALNHMVPLQQQQIASFNNLSISAAAPAGKEHSLTPWVALKVQSHASLAAATAAADPGEPSATVAARRSPTSCGRPSAQQQHSKPQAAAAAATAGGMARAPLSEPPAQQPLKQQQPRASAPATTQQLRAADINCIELLDSDSDNDCVIVGEARHGGARVPPPPPHHQQQQRGRRVPGQKHLLQGSNRRG